MKKIVFLLAFIIGLHACNSDGDETLTINKNGDENEYLVHLKKVKDSLSIKTSDFADNFQFVPLETKKECFLDYVYAYITDSYILVQKHKHGILQFDQEGKFLRTLVGYGKGPLEFIKGTWTVDEENQILYLSDMGKPDYFLRFDLHSGKYLGDLKKVVPGRVDNIYLHDNKQLLVSCSGKLGTDDHPYQIYWQDLDGEFINGIKASPNYYLRSSSLFKLPDGEYRYQIYDVDTIFSIKNEMMVPYMLFDFGEVNPPSNDYVGHKRMSLYFEVNSWVQFKNFYITKIENRGDGNLISITSGALANYTLDKKTSKVYNSGDLVFIPTNHSFTSQEYQSLSIQENGKVHYSYQALDLIEQAEKALADPEFRDPYRSQLEKVVSELDENSNPVLIVGKLQK